jgi:hypothetical protein
MLVMSTLTKVLTLLITNHSINVRLITLIAIIRYIYNHFRGLRYLRKLTYFTIELVNPTSWSVSAKTTYSLINATCLNNKTRNYLIKKVESSLPFLLIVHINFEASDALLRYLTYLLQR